MLKKAGIIAATATAGLLALSPLAFAGDKDGHDRGMSERYVTDVTQVDNSRSPECDLDATADNSVDQEGDANALALLGAATGGAVTNAGAPVNAQLQAPIASCNNIEDNFQDNDETVTEDSFNTED